MRDLRRVSGVFKQHEIMSVYTYRSILFRSVEEVLREVENRQVFMVADSGKNLRHPVVRFVHQVVEYQQRSPTTVERINVGQAVVKLYVFHLDKEILIHSVTPHDFLRRKIDQRCSMIYQFSGKYRLTRTAGTGDDSRKRVFEIHVLFNVN